MCGQDDIGIGWKNSVKILKKNDHCECPTLGFLILSNAVFLESKSEKKNDNAKVDEVGGTVELKLRDILAVKIFHEPLIFNSRIM